MQWQEIDIIDIWARPATKTARDAVSSVVREKAARGLPYREYLPLKRILVC